MTLIDCLAQDQCQAKLKKKRPWWRKLLEILCPTPCVPYTPCTVNEEVR